MSARPGLNRALRRGFAPFGGERAARLVPHARLAGPMPWVIAIMVALTVIAAAGGLALQNMADNARAELAGGATVQVLEALEQERERQAEAVEQVLSADPDVATYRRVPEAELEALLEPWLGVGATDSAVPVPALIDVRLRGVADRAAVERLQARLAEAAPGARVDAQSSWLGPVFGVIAALQWLAIALVALLALTSATAVWLAARSALGSNRNTIEIIHLLGGTDGQIARIFQRSIAQDALLGGIAGLAIGLAGMVVLARQFRQLGSGMVAGGGLAPVDWIVLGAIPLAGVVIATITARVTVLAALRKML
ncbi:cell division protein FtsX [Pelagerythrobacter marinus]|jgi:cell division transport system permease protein|uniref:cell division protein FtsX n=1 Tax=Pelagerythrobacter marinus TaxID=538382 RepID=UPI002037660C|nr:cell division protein [Pelagerythrobacter marinus]USA39479.1 cell division protein [Pelagerythrobacter marinus]WPZ06381.1 cell division protein [Pelagerythrobacter marinus]